jgi:hypothetical protein
MPIDVQAVRTARWSETPHDFDLVPTRPDPLSTVPGPGRVWAAPLARRVWPGPARLNGRYGHSP